MGQVPEDLGLEAIRFMDNPLVVIAPPDHPLVRKKRISIGDLAAESFLVRESVRAPAARWNVSSPPAGWKSAAAWK